MQNETTFVLLNHVLQRVEGADTEDEVDVRCNPAVIEARIPEGMVQRILLVLLYVMGA